jgi:hypothetical protein
MCVGIAMRKTGPHPLSGEAGSALSHYDGRGLNRFAISLIYGVLRYPKGMTAYSFLTISDQF